MNGIHHIKTTIIGVLLIGIAITATLLPFKSEVTYEPSLWLVGGLYLSGVCFIILDPKVLKEYLIKVLNKKL